MRTSLSSIATLVGLTLLRSTASAVTIDWTPIGNPGNPCDPQSQGCFGSAPYAYNIGTYEVTNAQYAEFLNAVAATDANALYNTGMGYYGISRTGGPGTYSYTPVAGGENLPVNFVSFYDGKRLANPVSPPG